MIAFSRGAAYEGAATRCKGMALVRPSPCQPARLLVELFPVIALQRIDEGEKYPQENQHDDTDVDPVVLHRFAYVVEVVDQVAREPLVFEARKRARRTFRKRFHEVLAAHRRFDQHEALGRNRSGLGLVAVLVLDIDELLFPGQAP